MFKISQEPLEPHVLKSLLLSDRAGACVTFEGWVRDHNLGQPVGRLDYEAYDVLAEKEGERILKEALEKFPLIHAICVHRVGALQIGDLAVWVGISAAHRGEAFDACRYIIDEVKARVPIWKREHYRNGVTEWVNCAHRGDHAGDVR